MKKNTQPMDFPKKFKEQAADLARTALGRPQQFWTEVEQELTRLNDDRTGIALVEPKGS